MSRRIVSLNGDDWRLGRSPATAQPHHAQWQELDQVPNWLPARVPGNVRADLINAGLLPDLVPGVASEAGQWVDDHCWWLVRDCALPVSPTERAHLILRGVDYVSDLFLNGHHLGRHEGMFSSQVHDVTGLLCDHNRIAVRIVGSRWLPQDRSTLWEKLLNQIEAKVSNMPGRFPHRRDTLKCQMGFGWDFAPPLRTMGIWDDVYAVVSEDVLIRDVIIRQLVNTESAEVSIHVVVDACQSTAAQLRCTLTTLTVEGTALVVERPIDITSGVGRHTITLLVRQPHLWWPWDHGRPDLYRLTVEVKKGERVLDSVARTVGLRDVYLDGWTLHVNGRPVYARGANWVPVHLLPGCVTDTDYSALLTQARQANMNLLRVWGGGLREKHGFYDLCDRLGILVWQEFPFSCAFLTRFPRSQEYLRLVEQEVRAIIRDLRNHPSLALWCGGNEFSPRRNAPLVAVVEQMVKEEDPTRPFLLASPSCGDSHYWEVWHNFKAPSAYHKDSSLFASEFGLQAPPKTTALQRFVPQEDLWPPGPAWTHHGAGLEKLWHYARPFLDGQSPALESFVEASQWAQAHGLRVAIEHYRRRKAAGCGGVLVWQLNEPWPAISWALLDFYRQPKPAFEMVRELFSPYLISLEYPLQRLQAGSHLFLRVWILNDTNVTLDDCQVEVVLWDRTCQPTHRFTGVVNVVACSAEDIATLQWVIPPGEGWRLTCKLTRNNEVLTSNEYDLALHDAVKPSWSQRLRATIRRFLLPA